MGTGYKKILWGIFIAKFSINLAIIEVLPPFIGFIIILRGISSLYKESEIESFNKAKTFAIILTIMTTIGEFIRFFSIGFRDYFIFNTVYIAFFNVIELLMFYKLFHGSIEYLNHNNQCDLAYKNIKKLRLYIIASLINIILLNFTLTFNIKIFNIIIVIMLIILRIYLIMWLYNLRKEVVLEIGS